MGEHKFVFNISVSITYISFTLTVPSIVHNTLSETQDGGHKCYHKTDKKCVIVNYISISGRNYFSLYHHFLKKKNGGFQNVYIKSTC